MNFFSLSAKYLSDRRKYIEDMERNNEMDKDTIEDTIDIMMMQDFERTCRLGIKLMNRFKEISLENENLKNDFYFITIRPNEKIINFIKFKKMIELYISQKVILDYKYSFEQKGTCIEDLGIGFHCHLICSFSYDRKSKILHNVCKFFKDVAASNCIQVDKCKNPEELIQNYLVDYISNDEHKECTKIWDNAWRQQEGLLKLYELSLSSPIGLTNIIV